MYIDMSMDVSRSLAQLSMRSFIAALREQDSATLIRGCYSRSTLQHLVQSLEMLAIGSGAGALIVSAALQQDDDWQHYHSPATPAPVCRLTLALDDDIQQSELFLCALGTTCSLVLCGTLLENPGDNEEAHVYEVRWSFAPSTVEVLLDLVAEHLARGDPEQLAVLQDVRQRFPLGAPDPELLLGLSAELLSFNARHNSVLAATTKEMESRLRWHEDQMRMMVHDIRAPLHTLLISIKSLLRKQLDAAAQHELLSVAYDTAQLMQNLIDTTMDALRLEAGRMPLKYQPLRIATLIQTVCEPFELAARPDQPHMRRQVAEELPILWGDRGLLERVLTNLLTNSFKYTPSTGEIFITARLTDDGRAIELAVGDSGQGIAPNAQPHIFERFYQANPSDWRQGAGLGLYFCRIAVEAHGGTIGFTSTLGVGSIFKVVLPLTPEEQMLERAVSH